MVGSLIRLGRRQLHTIISREIIKPASPTPSHLHPYNLSVLDRFGPPAYSPVILFYPNHENCSLTTLDKANVMKKALSRSLTRYYPLAGRLHPSTAPCVVDCNDQGVEFIEANNDCQLDTFQHMSEHDESLDQLFPNGMVCYNSPGNTNALAVKLNHFACGGLGVAISLSHVIGDACTLGSFVAHWVSVARYGSVDHKEVEPLNPHFLNSSNHGSFQDHVNMNHGYGNRVTRKFIFRNSKLNDLKNMVEDGSPLSVNNPTRVEILSSLLYKTAMSAATTKSGSFKTSYLIFPVDVRKILEPKLPQTTVGNILSHMMVKTSHTNEISFSS